MLDAVRRHEKAIGRSAWLAAWFALFAGQLHALSRHRTVDGRSDLESPSTRAWAEPAGEVLSPILDWATADVVYLTYGKLWLPIFLAFTLCALVVRRNRQPAGFEKWAWRVALTGYVGACVSVFAEYWLMWTEMNDTLLNGVFVAIIPFILITIVGSTVLGIALLRKGVRLPAVFLTLAVPGVFLIPQVTSLGNVVLPIAFAFGIWGRRIARDADTARAERNVPSLAATSGGR